MFASSAAFVYARENAAKYTLYLLFIHRERFLVFILWNGCVPFSAATSRRYENHAIDIRHFVQSDTAEPL